MEGGGRKRGQSAGSRGYHRPYRGVRTRRGRGRGGEVSEAGLIPPGVGGGGRAKRGGRVRAEEGGSNVKSTVQSCRRGAILRAKGRRLPDVWKGSRAIIEGKKGLCGFIGAAPPR